MPNESQYSSSMEALIERFAKLPGIGKRTAERLAFHLLLHSKDDAMALAQAIRDVKVNVKHCSVCFNLTEIDPCAICADAGRDRCTILVVEQPRDVVSLENAGAFKGMYHVLMGRLAPLEGIEPKNLTIPALLARVRLLAEQGQDVEVILGTNPNLEGDGTALYLADAFSGMEHVQVTRLARGLPTGSQIEYANRSVLSDAIHSRQKLRD